MMCPLLLMGKQNPDCCEELCAWWEEQAKKCGIKELEAIAINLAQIANCLLVKGVNKGGG